MQFKRDECKPGFFLELYQRSKPTWASIKAALESEISDIEFDMLEPYDQSKDYTVMAARRAWLFDLARHIPKSDAVPPESAGRAMRIRKIEIK
jgi:hypothetical protein